MMHGSLMENGEDTVREKLTCASMALAALAALTSLPAQAAASDFC
jgi:hypothetical protein